MSAEFNTFHFNLNPNDQDPKAQTAKEEVEPSPELKEIPSGGVRGYLEEQRRKAILNSYLISHGPEMFNQLIRQLPRPVDGNLPDDASELARRTEVGLATEAEEIRDWFDKVIEGRIGTPELTQLVSKDMVSHIVVLSHGRFIQKDGDTIVAEHSDECEDRVQVAIDAYGLGWREGTQPPRILLAGATQQLALMERYAIDYNPRSRYNLPDHVPNGVALRYLDCQPFPDCNTKTQFEAIDQLATGKISNTYERPDQKIVILTSDYHVARCMLYLYRWVEPAVRDKILIVGMDWAFDPNRMDEAARTELLNAEKERCVLYGTRKPDGQRGDLARPWEA